MSDPYRITIQRALADKKIKEKRVEYFEKNKNFGNNNKPFLDQPIKIPENISNIIGISIFAFLPYTIGLIFIFLIIAKANIELYQKSDINSFLLAWTIGYEIIAIVILLLIIKSALTFKQTQVNTLKF